MLHRYMEGYIESFGLLEGPQLHVSEGTNFGF